MERTPMPHEIYRHFKGNLYQIITIAEHSETGERLVVYQALYGDYRAYARPLAMFLEKVDQEKYPQADQEYRFERVMPGMENGKAEKQTARQSAGTAWQSAGVAGQLTGAAGTAGQAGTAEQTTGTAGQEAAEQAEDGIPDLDPMVLEFLDADTYEDRLNILAGLHHRITDDMINIMAMATDIEVKQGDVEERYAQLRGCLLKLEKFECSRLR